jgi:hypothetical protein
MKFYPIDMVCSMYRLSFQPTRHSVKTQAPSLTGPPHGYGHGQNHGLRDTKRNAR